jgi:hypothetical protein
MNWQAIGAIGEIGGAVAVLVSLIYLATQIRQNTKMMRSSAKQELTISTQNLIYKAIDNSDIWVKLTKGEQASSPEEDARMSLLVRAMLRGFEAQAYQYQAGLLEKDEWQALRAAIIGMCALPGVARYWEQLRPQMSQRLQSIVEECDRQL